MENTKRIDRNATASLTITAPQDWQQVLHDYLRALCTGPMECLGMTINDMLDEAKYYGALGKFMYCLNSYTLFAANRTGKVSYQYDNYFDDEGKPRGYFGLLITAEGGYTCMVMVRDDLSVSGHS